MSEQNPAVAEVPPVAVVMSMIPNMQTEPKVQKPTKPIVSIKGGRKKAGEQQYCVIYEGESGEKGHWFREIDLDCKDLIEAYEQSRKEAKDEAKREAKKKAVEEGAPVGSKKVVEIFGVVSDEMDSYVVKVQGSAAPQIVSRSFLHKHAAKLLLEFYEKNIHWDEIAEKQPNIEEVQNEQPDVVE